MDAVRQPFSVNLLAQAAACEAILHQDDVADRVEKNLVERLFVEEELSGLGLEVADSQANFVWVNLGDREEDEVLASLTKSGVAVRPGAALGAAGQPPRHLRHARREQALHRCPRRRDLIRARSPAVGAIS